MPEPFRYGKMIDELWVLTPEENEQMLADLRLAQYREQIMNDVISMTDAEIIEMFPGTGISPEEGKTLLEKVRRIRQKRLTERLIEGFTDASDK